jgi:hypothetical protein
MQCEHVWISKQVDTPNGGYMILKFCHACGDTEGFGFVDKDHEIAYLESLLNEDDML